MFHCNLFLKKFLIYKFCICTFLKLKWVRLIVQLLNLLQTSSEYPGFLEVLIRDLATPMEPDDVKKLATVLNTLASEKHKALKAVKGKKKTKKVALGGSNKASKGVDLHDYSTTYGDEYDGFI